MGFVSLILHFRPLQEEMMEKYLDEVSLRESESRISMREASTGPKRLNALGSSSDRMSLKELRP